MQTILKLVLIGLVGVAARADILRLRDGRMFTGNFLGATRTEIWFQRDTPGDIIGAAAYPVDSVESVTFGPAMRQSNSKADGADVTLPVIFGNRPNPLRPTRLLSPRPSPPL